MQEMIGEGGFADVWRVVLQGTNQVFALKKLRDHRNAEARHRFAREVRMLQGLQHPHVIRIVEANIDAAEPFYVMPLMGGGALTKLAGRLPHANVRLVLEQLADFLSYLHAQGGLHRDIKPDNLLIDDAGRLVVGDFGLGNNPRFTVMMTAHACGTWGYAAPELRLPFGFATAAADIYSLGATIFHLLTGVHPKDAPVLDPWAFGATAPRDLRDLVLRMADPDPRRRPTARQILDALRSPQPQQAMRPPQPFVQRFEPPRPPASPLPQPAPAANNNGVKTLVGLGLLALFMGALSRR